MTSTCDNSHSPLATESEALEIMLSGAAPVNGIEHIDTLSGLGRTLAEPQFSLINVPPVDNSAMDGYAVSSSNTPETGEINLPVSQRIAAGHKGTALEPGTAARVFTGAALPPGADSVVLQENCTEGNGIVTIPLPLQVGKHIRKAGEDIIKGSEILPAGTRLRPQELGLLASTGIAEIPVYRKLKVAVFFTGDELLTPGATLTPGKIYNSNRYTLTGLLTALGCDIIDLGVVEDSPEATCTALEHCATDADLIISCGGVSVGEEDYVKNAVEQLGRLDLWRVAIKPGKPLAFGHIGTTPFIGLPGNPASVFVTFCIFARPFILRHQGDSNSHPLTISAQANFERPHTIKRREYLRARLETSNGGINQVDIFPEQGSGALSSASWANCLAIVPENTTVTRGQMIKVLPFSELLT